MQIPKFFVLLHGQFDYVMKHSEQTLQQIGRAIRKIADKFPSTQEAEQLTDIHIHVNQDTGELTFFDDDDKEITRCIVEEWIDDKSDDFYDQVADLLRQAFRNHSEMVEAMSILKPYAFVLDCEDVETQYEIFVVDDDTVIIDSALMANMDEDLDSFFNELMKN